MRLLIVFFSAFACLGARAQPLPEIVAGSSGRVVEISMTPWYSGSVGNSVAFLTGQVVEVSSGVQTSPQQTWLSESCVVRVERVFGHLKRLEGVTSARLKAGYDYSPYEPVSPEWGRLRHLQKGRRILLLLHEHDGEPCFGFAALIEFSRAAQDLPRILRRTGFDLARFESADLAVLQAASPALHKEVQALGSRNGTGQDPSSAVNSLLPAWVAVFFVLIVVIDCIRRM